MSKHLDNQGNTMNYLYFIEMRRKTPSFRAGDLTLPLRLRMGSVKTKHSHMSYHMKLRHKKRRMEE